VVAPVKFTFPLCQRSRLRERGVEGMIIRPGYMFLALERKGNSKSPKNEISNKNKNENYK
jgi:hypothetical protein